MDRQRAMTRPLPAQIRGARAMMDWSMIDLAKAAGVSVSTVKRVEDIASGVVSLATVGLIQGALEAAGMQFLADDGDGPGMRLRPRQVSPVSRFF